MTLLELQSAASAEEDGTARSRLFLLAAAVAAALLGIIALPAAARAQTVEDKAQLCAACHGENGVPQQKTTPVIWGQHQGYLYLQLRDYKSGARKNDIMSRGSPRRSSATT